LQQHEPLKAKHVLSRMQAMHSGRDYDSRWDVRQRGEGEYAQLLNLRFKTACKKYGLKTGERFVHDTSLFRPPASGPEQLALL
jgi:hypothetical protein